MSSSDRQGFDGQGAVPPPRRSERELLDLVYAKAAAGRRAPGSPVLVGVAAAVVLVGGLVAFVGREGDGPATEVRAVSGPPTSAVALGPTPTLGVTASVVTPPTTAAAVAVPPTTTAARAVAPDTPVAPRRPATTSTTVACRNSSDPACGPLRWDPDPGPNLDLVVSVTATPANPRAGTPVTFTVVGVDPDAQVVNRFGRFGDNTSADGPAISGCTVRHGPWDPPAPEPGRMEVTVEHVYATPGTYTATFELQSAAICDHPYGSRASASVQVIVTP